MAEASDIESITPLCGNGRVLIACEEKTRLAVAHVVSDLGFDPIVCDGPGDVLAMAKQHRPDVAFLDFSIPETDWGSVVRVLARCPDTRCVAPVVICPPNWEKLTRAKVIAGDVFEMLARPVTRERMVECLLRAQRQSHELRLRFEQPTGPREPATRHVAGNNSLLMRNIICPFHDEQVTLQRYILRAGRIQTESSFFDLPLYLAPPKNADFVDFNLLHIAVCPKCLFASNNPAYFIDPSDAKQPRPTFTKPTIEAMAAGLQQRQDIGIGISQDFHSAKRSLQDGLISHELAIQCSQIIYEHNKYTLPVELVRLGNLHLREAYLLEKLEAGVEHVDVHYQAAFESLKKAFMIVEHAVLFKTAYQLVAIAIFLGEEKSAYQYIARLTELERSGELDKQDMAALQRYLPRCKTAWEDRRRHCRNKEKAA